MITSAQKSRLLRYIRDAEVCPSFREMKRYLHFKSTSQTMAVLDALETDGSIRRLRYRARAIEVVRPVSKERRQFFRFDPETKKLVQFTPGSSSVSEEKQRETASETEPKTQKGPAFPPAP